MPKGKRTELLLERLHIQVRDLHLFETAMTHTTYVNENRSKDPTLCSNERLEFLGDAVLQIVISEYLYLHFGNCAEGEMSEYRRHLVCETTLYRMARKIGLGDYLWLGNGAVKNGDRERPSVLSDAFEAFLAALYLDGGENGFAHVREFLLPLMRDELANCRISRDGDFKTLLQQFVQQDGNEALHYEVVEEHGPQHDKTYTVQACINSNAVGVGIGKSKQEAEQIAAREALRYFGIEHFD